MNSKSSEQKINWRQAIAEMVLIIAGVLIALGVDAWWDERQVRKAEIDYLVALQQDFEANRASLVPRIQDRLDLVAVGDEVLQMIKAGLTEESSEAFFSKLSNELYYFDQWSPGTATYDNMVAAGHVMYLQDQNLRNKLSEFRKRLDEVRLYEGLQTKTFYERQSPFLEKHQNLNYSNWSDVYQPPVSPFTVGISPFESLEFWNLIVEWIFVLQDTIVNYRDAQADCEQILELIGAELAAKR